MLELFLYGFQGFFKLIPMAIGYAVAFTISWLIITSAADVVDRLVRRIKELVE